MNPDEMQEFLKEHSDRIKEAAVAAVIERVKESIRYGLPAEVQAIVADFMKNEIAPAVALALKSEKDGIVAAAAKAAGEIGAELSKVMVTNAVKNMTGYQGSDIIKKLFGG